MTTNDIVSIVEQNRIQMMKEYDVLKAKAETIQMKDISKDIPVILEITKTDDYDIGIIKNILIDSFKSNFFKNCNCVLDKKDILFYDDEFLVRISPINKKIYIKHLSAKYSSCPRYSKPATNERFNKLLELTEVYLNNPNIKNLITLSKSNYNSKFVSIRMINETKKRCTKKFLEDEKREIDIDKERETEYNNRLIEYKEECSKREFFINQIKEDIRVFLNNDSWNINTYLLKVFIESNDTSRE